MKKYIYRVICTILVLLTIVLYFSINHSFGNDVIVLKVLEKTDIVSNIFRLLLYIIPGISLITGLFGLVFYTKKVLYFFGIINLFSSIASLVFLRGESKYMLCLSGFYILIAIAYLFFSKLID